MQRLRKRLTTLAACLATCFAVQAGAQMKVHVIDVGQAESILLELPSAAVLIDAGGEDTGNTRDRDHLIGYLDTFFQRRPDLDRTLYSVVVSHPHIDHTRHLMDVLRSYRVRNLVDGGGTTGSGIAQAREARRFARERGIVYNRVSEDRMGARGYVPSMLRALRNTPSDVDIRFLGGFVRGCDDENNQSVVTLVTYREATFLFTGDAESEDKHCTPEIRRLLERYRASLLDVDVYKVGHHGSHNGTSLNLLTVMSPEISILSTGHRDTRAPERFHAWFFGHPRESAVAMIERATTGSRPPVSVYTMNGVQNVRENRRMERAVYCTCWDGDVVISVDPTGRQLSVQTSGR